MKTNMTTLKSMIASIGARKAPQKAPIWDRKHLQRTYSRLDSGKVNNVIL
jgi:hypothetical protein